MDYESDSLSDYDISELELSDESDVEVLDISVDQQSGNAAVEGCKLSNVLSR